MRFLVTALIFCLMSVTHAVEAAEDGHSCHMDKGKKKGHHCKRKKMLFEYDMYVTASDDVMGKAADEDDDEDNEGFMVRSATISADFGIGLAKKWDEFSLETYLALTEATLSNGLLIATVTAEMPRSYLSVTAGKGRLNFGGFWEHTSPYLRYHSPFPKYALMARVFAPIEGVGELSVMFVNDVRDDEPGKGWNNDHESIAPLLQYTGKLGPVEARLQFAPYDYGNESWYNSWAFTGSMKMEMHGFTAIFDYTRDNRKLDSADDTTLVYNNYVLDLSYRTGMVEPNLAGSLFMAASDTEDSPVDGNIPTDHKGYADLSGAERYAYNMMALRVGLDFHCVENKLVPYVAYAMKSHKMDPDLTKADSEVEEQMSHSFILGVKGVI